MKILEEAIRELREENENSKFYIKCIGNPKYYSNSGLYLTTVSGDPFDDSSWGDLDEAYPFSSMDDAKAMLISMAKILGQGRGFLEFENYCIVEVKNEGVIEHTLTTDGNWDSFIVDDMSIEDYRKLINDTKALKKEIDDFENSLWRNRESADVLSDEQKARYEELSKKYREIYFAISDLEKEYTSNVYDRNGDWEGTKVSNVEKAKELKPQLDELHKQMNEIEPELSKLTKELKALNIEKADKQRAEFNTNAKKDTLKANSELISKSAQRMAKKDGFNDFINSSFVLMFPDDYYGFHSVKSYDIDNDGNPFIIIEGDIMLDASEYYDKFYDEENESRNIDEIEFAEEILSDVIGDYDPEKLGSDEYTANFRVSVDDAKVDFDEVKQDSDGDIEGFITLTVKLAITKIEN